MKQNESGQMLAIALGIVLLLLIIVPNLVKMVQTESRQTDKQRKSTIAFNIAETAVERGMWKLKESTGAWDNAYRGNAIPGYNFDVTHTDVDGGSYRIRITSGPNLREVTIVGEGKDQTSQEVRAIRAVFRNTAVPGAMISRGVITWANAFSAHWGAIMAHGNINITDANAAMDYFPRKYSRQVVAAPGFGQYARDVNGIDPPNTDGVEWWSDYPVPDLPVLDFAALRSSAAATNTLNIYGCSKMSSNPNPPGHPWRWWVGSGYNYSCNLGGGSGSHTGQRHFQNPWRHPWHASSFTWYWDNDVIFTGGTGARGCGIIGNIIIRGNFTNYCGDNLYWNEIGLENCRVPSEAWREYAKITKTTGDTAAINEYPADNGYQTCRPTFRFGAETWTGGQNPPPAGNTDVGIKGFLYVGGNYNIEGPMDIYGAVWVVGNVSKAVGAERTIIFYDENLDLPTLNVVLLRRSWQEIPPSGTW